MKHLKHIKIVILILFVFFFLQLTSQIFLKLGLNKKNPPRSGLLKASTQIFPIDAELFYEYATAILEEYAYLKVNEGINLNKSVDGFKKAIVLNPLMYSAHFNLAKSYQIDKSGNTTIFDDALKYFKHALFLRGNKSEVSVEILTLMLSLWPLLEDSDKEFSQQLLNRSIKNITRKEFAPILEAWSLYSRDIDVIKNALKKRPEFCKDVSDKLEQLELHLDTRQNILAEYEVYYLEYFRNGLEDYLKNTPNKLKGIQSRLNRLRKMVPGYHRMLGKNDFNNILFSNLKNRLYSGILEIFLSERKRYTDANDRKNTVFNFIDSLLKTHSSQAEEKNLNRLLTNKSFYQKPGLKKQYIELLLHFKMKNKFLVIQRGEELRNSLSFVREDQKEVYGKILILLAETYIQNDQFDKAESILAEAKSISPGNLETYWLECKMIQAKSEIINITSENSGTGGRRQKLEKRPSEVGNRMSEIEEKCDQVWNSRVINLNKIIVKKAVFFMDTAEIMILMDEQFRTKIRNKHLLQVFVDGWIFYEQYLGKVKDEVKVKDGEWKKFEVEVRVR